MVKKYKVKVALRGFEKIINRTYEVNDNVKINDFCTAIITTMNGDLDHLYELKYKDKRYICNYMDRNSYNEIKMGTTRISKLLLDEKDKLELVYDFGDNWIFKITINKVLEGHNYKNIILIDGTGNGIQEDCGGIWGLADLIEDKDNEWEYDINDFDIDNINEYLDEHYNKRN